MRKRLTITACASDAYTNDVYFCDDKLNVHIPSLVVCPANPSTVTHMMTQSFAQELDIVRFFALQAQQHRPVRGRYG